MVTRFGMSGYMMDRGEEDGIPALAAPGGGPRLKRVRDVPPRAVNAAAVQYPMILNHLLTRARGPDFFLYGRNLYDRGRQFASAWNGDTRGWDGLEETVKHQLRAGLIGLPILGSDVGGYRHPLWGYHADPELYLRWTELADMGELLGPGRDPPGRSPDPGFGPGHRSGRGMAAEAGRAGVPIRLPAQVLPRQHRHQRL